MTIPSGASQLQLGVNDNYFTDNTGSWQIQTTEQISTTTVATSSNAATVYGAPVTFTATVTAASGNGETGTIQFQIDGVNAGSPVPLSGNTAAYTTTDVNAGTHSVVALYSGDGNFAASTSAAFVQSVAQAAAATAISSSNGSTIYGQPVTFTATVTPASRSAKGGDVQFQVDGNNKGSPVDLTGNMATYTTSTLATGSHLIVAVYSGDSNLTASTSPALTQDVAQATTTTAVSSSSALASNGQPVTFTATVKPTSGNGETGTVQFQIDGNDVGSPLALNGDTVAYATSELGVGSHLIVAVYSGDSNFATSTSSTFPQSVAQAATTTSITSGNGSAIYGQSVAFTVTVTPNVGVGPTGTAQIQIDGISVGNAVALSGGTAAYATSTLSAGSHSISAVYSGDSNFAGSTSATFTQAVMRTATAVAVTSDNAAPVYGQPLTFTSAVTPNVGAGPTGTVQFQIDGGNVGSPQPLSGNIAAYTISTLAVGSHSIVAVYSGDDNFISTTSAVFTQNVAQAATSTAVTSNNASPVYGQPVTFTATVTPVVGSGETGTVQFQIDGSDVGGPVSLSGNTAAYTTATLSAGSHTVVAAYSGDDYFPTSTSPAITSSVSQAVLSLSLSTMYLKLDADAQHMDMWNGTADSGTPAQSFLISNYSSMTCAGPAGGDLSILDFSNGDPLPASALTFTGGGGQNTLEIIGTSGNDAATVNGSTITVSAAFGSASIAYSSANTIIFNGNSSGSDTLIQAAQPGGGANLIFASPTAQDTLDINGGFFTVPANAPDAGTLNYSLGTISIAAGAELALSQSDSQSDQTILTANNLSVAGALDITNNILRTSELNVSLPQVTTWVQSKTITSSFVSGAHALASRAVGYGDYAEDSGIVPYPDVEVKYVPTGDTNLDGVVDISDLTRAINNLGHSAGYSSGDILNQGIVNITDIAAIINDLGAHLNSSGNSVVVAASGAEVQPSAGSLSTAMIPVKPTARAVTTSATGKTSAKGAMSPPSANASIGALFSDTRIQVDWLEPQGSVLGD